MKKSRPSRQAPRSGGDVTSELEYILRGQRLPPRKTCGHGWRNTVGLVCVLFVSLTISAMTCAYLPLWMCFLNLGLALSGAILTAMFRR